MIEETTVQPSLNPFVVILFLIVIFYVYHNWPDYKRNIKDQVGKLGENNTNTQSLIERVHTSLNTVVLHRSSTDEFPKQLRSIHKKHVMIVGGTGNGKSTFKAFLATYLRQQFPNCLIITIDPHFREKDMVPVDEMYGQGRDYQNIIDGGQQILTELNRRYEDYGKGIDDFIPTFVFVDELTAISQNTKDFRPIQHQISCEGRKVGIFLFLNVHSLQVSATGFERMSDLYENFVIFKVNKPYAYLEYVDENGNPQKEKIKFWPVL